MREFAMRVSQKTGKILGHALNIFSIVGLFGRLDNMVTSKVNPKFSAELGALSTGAAAFSTGVKFGRAAISGDPKDMQKAKDSAVNTVASKIAGNATAKKGSVLNSIASYAGSKTTNIINWFKKDDSNPPPPNNGQPNPANEQ